MGCYYSCATPRPEGTPFGSGQGLSSYRSLSTFHRSSRGDMNSAGASAHAPGPRWLAASAKCAKRSVSERSVRMVRMVRVMGGEGDERRRACIRAQSWYGTGGRRACAGMRMRGRPRRYLCGEERALW
jgi:hypothetical protein